MAVPVTHLALALLFTEIYIIISLIWRLGVLPQQEGRESERIRGGVFGQWSPSNGIKLLNPIFPLGHK